MTATTRPHLTGALNEAEVARVRVGDVDMPAVWPGSGVPATRPVPAPAAAADPGLSVEVADLPPAGESRPARLPRWWRRRRSAQHLPDGVLPPAGRDLSTLVGVVGVSVVAEAGWNLGFGVYKLLHLPLPLAAMFPMGLEAAAASCALQEMRDRRQGVPDPKMEAGAYVGLAASSMVNGAVGYATHGAAGLLEILPPVVLGGLFYLHGRRQERSYKTRARLSPVWQAEQLEQAQVESAVEALPLLAGDCPDGKATVALLTRRLREGTLTPSNALTAAGWHDREDRLSEILLDVNRQARRRRLETIAATVWPDGVPPAPVPVASVRRVVTASAVARTASAGAWVTASADASRDASGPASRGASPGASAAASRGAPGGAASADSDGGLRTATDGEIIAAIAAVWAENPGAGERPIGAYLRDQLGLTASSARIRPHLQQARTEAAGLALAAAQGQDDQAGGGARE